MGHSNRLKFAPLCAGLALVVAICLGSNSRAQDFGAPADAEPARIAPVVTDPTALAVLQTNPTTPSQLLRAVGVLINLRQAAAALPLVEKLRDAGLDDAGYVALTREFGSGAFIRLSTTPELQPVGQQLCDAALAAENRVLRDPARLAGLIAQLSAATEAERRSAMSELKVSREVATAELVHVLADPERSAEHARVRQALVYCGESAVAPIIAALVSTDSNLVVQLTQAANLLNDPRVAPYLFAPAYDERLSADARQAAGAVAGRFVGRLPERSVAAGRLFEHARARYDELNRTGGPSADAQETIWTWNAAESRPVPVIVPARVASLDYLARNLADAHRMLPGNGDIRRLHHTVALDEQATRDGLESLDSSDGALAAGTALANLAEEELCVVDELLANSQRSIAAPAALAAVSVLARRADRDLLLSKAPEPCALARSLGHPDRRVRFAAARAIMKLAPDAPYPGASFLVDAIEYFIASSGSPTALAADLRASEASRLAGLLATVGYESDSLTNDRSLVARATATPDLDLILIEYHLAMPASGQLIRELRVDSRTALVPIGIVATVEDMPAAEHLAGGFARTMAIVRPNDPAGIDFEVRELLARFPAGATPMNERTAQATTALEWAGVLADLPHSIYALGRLERPVSAAVWNPPHAKAAAALLARMGTHVAQRTLLDVANLATMPIEPRRDAAMAFADSVARHGTLLTTTEIVAQYDRYNASERLDRDTQQVLGAILDVIEARAGDQWVVGN